MTEFRKFDWGWDVKAVLAAVIWALIAPVPSTFGDPPALSSAHDWLAKRDPFYLGYTGKKWDRDYGVVDGRCSRQAIAAALGSATGGANGSRAGQGESRQVATTVGTVFAANTGRDMDEKDRACLGYALELGGLERGVAWTNADNGLAYRVIPLGGFTDNGRSCREFVTRVSASGRDETVRHRACSTGDGVWQIIG